MLHATGTLGEGKCPECCKMWPSLVENGTESGRQKLIAFSYLSQKLNVVLSVFKHVKELVYHWVVRN